MSAWSNLEVMLSIWFITITGIKPNRLAYAIFFSGKGFAARIDMLNAALEHGKQSRTVTPLLKEIILKALAYSNARNRMAHSYFDTPAEKGDRLLPGHSWYRDQPGLTLQDMLNASRNLSAFSTIIDDCWRGDGGRKRRGRPSPKLRRECLERLFQLPSEACSNEVSQKQRGRLRQLQAAERGLRKRAQK